MVDVDKMSDAELRSKLIEFGFPVMPITGTTRKTMMKKLKMLMENKNNIGKSSTGRRSLGRYSSEDDSDSDTKTAAASIKKDKYKRQTMGAPMMQPPSLKKRTIKADSPLEAPPPPVKREVKTSTTTTRTMKILEAAKDDFDTGSESDEVAEKYNNSSTRESPNLSDRFKSMSQSSPNRLPTSFLSAASAVDAASDRINQIRSRLSQYNSSYERSTYSTDAGDLLKDREDTPFLSNFTKRLSQLSDTPSTSYDYKNDVIKENDVNGASASTRTYLNNFRATKGRPTTFDYRSSNSSIFKNNFVPFMVLIVAFLFFIIVAVVYLGIRSDGTSLDVTAKVPVCVKSDSSSRRYVNCVLEGEGKPAFHLLEVLKPELQKRALKNTCDDHKVKPYMTEAEIVNYVTQHFAIKNETRIMNDLSNLEVLTFYNPSWGISIAQLDEDGIEFKSDAIVKDMESVLEGKRSKVTALIASSLNVPWSCYFYNTILFFIKMLGSLTGGVLVLYLLNNAFKYYKQLRHKQQDEEISMVENIIDILQTNVSDTSSDNYMVINHVRDMILPVNERKAKQKIWARAVKYIADHESRIRTEIQTVRGEPSEVWRWLGGSNLNTSKSKTWQGQAFETEVGSVNSLPCSPTPCLKIRGMIEEGDTNTLAIKKAVASKCAQQCRILHCGVDTKLNCVYLKCADTSDAAIAYRNLHGWWYAGNLVTVKYLRLERYMQRFPDSPVKGPPYLQ